ncbi:hypothetical protein TVAG_038080 [Trichomonas vaginalis G3]|uniref:Uncharacterized protein n=1 Tax=Trichomonas vaginalis (strain ATCC PRA-98 / G3) TaxID=412133 RepID=A2DXW6_TRIV3|nr:hypothetical protein TVAGG3_0961260 [Trichomonas vaginalis G3]EAY14702.1 hypothetical protein TVAG_038080 [Trichomonas vaginalis G3]KAI5487926.1 hypothetical protein TVAGG3_0961260 [Trichomonas vaginalis G3]|eukprot:XP_001326925.1 hypothetical protein [Trichomonas vaginalis G3]
MYLLFNGTTDEINNSNCFIRCNCPFILESEGGYMTINELMERNRINAAEPGIPRSDYASWQEDGILPDIEGEKIIYKCVPFYTVDASVLTYNTQKSFTRNAVAGNSCILRCCTTIPYKIFYDLLCILGYNGIAEFFWGYKATRITFQSHKYYSIDPSKYRAKQGCLDPKYATPALIEDI